MFERNPGVAPGNVLAILSKMGKKTALNINRNEMRVFDLDIVV